MPFVPGDYAVILNLTAGGSLAHEVVRNVTDPAVLKEVARSLYRGLLAAGKAPPVSQVTPMAKPISRLPAPAKEVLEPEARPAPARRPARTALEETVHPTAKTFQVPPAALEASKRRGGCDVTLPVPSEGPGDPIEDLTWVEANLERHGLQVTRIRRDLIGEVPSVVVGLVVEDPRKAMKWMRGETRQARTYEAIPGKTRRVVVRRQEVQAA